jgi:hypothetical protein
VDVIHVLRISVLLTLSIVPYSKDFFRILF